MIIVMDCETTGLPKNYKASVADTDNWPRAVQIAWALYENNGERIEGLSYIVKPDGYEISAEATALHGITTEHALEAGLPVSMVLSVLCNDLQNADYVVGHNIDFDKNVIGAELIRDFSADILESMKSICTMKASTEFCQIPGKNGGFKWPKLSELYEILFNEKLENEHNADADVSACARCFFELVKRGVIKIDQPKQLDETIEQERLKLEADLNEREAIADMTVNDPGLDALAAAIDEETEAEFDLTDLSPLALGLALSNAYRFQERARRDLFEAARNVDIQKRELARKQNAVRTTEAFKALGNDIQRKAHVEIETAEISSLLSAAEDILSEAQYHFNDSSAEVELAKALLRVGELAANVYRMD